MYNCIVSFVMVDADKMQSFLRMQLYWFIMLSIFCIKLKYFGKNVVYPNEFHFLLCGHFCPDGGCFHYFVSLNQ